MVLGAADIPELQARPDLLGLWVRVAPIQGQSPQVLKAQPLGQGGLSSDRAPPLPGCVTLDKFLPRSGEGLAGAGYEATVWSCTDAAVAGKAATAPLVLTVVASSVACAPSPSDFLRFQSQQDTKQTGSRSTL